MNSAQKSEVETNMLSVRFRTTLRRTTSGNTCSSQNYSVFNLACRTIL